MKQLYFAGGMIALMSTTAFAQATQGLAAGHADVTIDATRTGRTGVSNSGITTGINHRPSGVASPQRDSNGLPSTRAKTTPGLNTQP